MTTTTWIIIAVAAVLLLAVIALVVGLQLRKKRQISLTKAEERKELTREERSGNYQAGTGFSFAQGGGVAAPLGIGSLAGAATPPPCAKENPVPAW